MTMCFRIGSTLRVFLNGKTPSVGRQTIRNLGGAAKPQASSPENENFPPQKNRLDRSLMYVLKETTRGVFSLEMAKNIRFLNI